MMLFDFFSCLLGRVVGTRISKVCSWKLDILFFVTSIREYGASGFICVCSGRARVSLGLCSLVKKFEVKENGSIVLYAFIWYKKYKRNLKSSSYVETSVEIRFLQNWNCVFCSTSFERKLMLVGKFEVWVPQLIYQLNALKKKKNATFSTFLSFPCYWMEPWVGSGQKKFWFSRI